MLSKYISGNQIVFFFPTDDVIARNIWSGGISANIKLTYLGFDDVIAPDFTNEQNMFIRISKMIKVG